MDDLNNLIFNSEFAQTSEKKYYPPSIANQNPRTLSSQKLVDEPPLLQTFSFGGASSQPSLPHNTSHQSSYQQQFMHQSSQQQQQLVSSQYAGQQHQYFPPSQ